MNNWSWLYWLLFSFFLFSEIHWRAGSNHPTGRIWPAGHQLEHTVINAYEFRKSLRLNSKKCKAFDVTYKIKMSFNYYYYYKMKYINHIFEDIIQTNTIKYDHFLLNTQIEQKLVSGVHINIELKWPTHTMTVNLFVLMNFMSLTPIVQ